ncbi:MAG: SpoIIE family protein phosphatase [Planctomycetota bacterium]|nr:SpoIIE family protein phosphatase [Planctomycetota bacterium]
MYRRLRGLKDWLIGPGGALDATEYPAIFRAGHLARYGFTIGTVAAALALTLGVQPLREQPPTLLFFTAVILTSWYAGTRAGLLASVLSIAALDFFFVAPLYSMQIEVLDLVDFAAFAGATWLISTLQARWRRTHRSLVEVEQEMQLARQIQQRMFPASPPSCQGFDIAGVCLPASATGGDFFDYIPVAGNSLGIVVGDVSGHGLGPALGMALVHAYLRALALTQTRPDEILTRANQIVCEETENGWFATVFLASLVAPSRSLTYAAAGHEAYLLDESGEVTVLPATGMPLGISRDEEIASGVERILQPGQILLLVSDGILESASPDTEMFGLMRLVELVHKGRGQPAREIAEALCRAAQTHAQPAAQTDDMTVVVIKA